MKYCDVAVSEGLRVVNHSHQPNHHFLHLSTGGGVLGGFHPHGVVENGATENVASITVALDADVHEEDWEFLFAVLFVPGLCGLDSEVSSCGRVAEGED